MDDQYKDGLASKAVLPTEIVSPGKHIIVSHHISMLSAQGHISSWEAGFLRHNVIIFAIQKRNVLGKTTLSL